jgi:hypothetical protein
VGVLVKVDREFCAHRFDDLHVSFGDGHIDFAVVVVNQRRVDPLTLA